MKWPIGTVSHGTMKMENLEGMILAELLRWDDVRCEVFAHSVQARAIWRRAK